MFILSEKIAPPITSRNEDDVQAVRAKQLSDDDEDRCVQDIIDNLAGFARKIGLGKMRRH